ncbi:VWA domain-containing protein [bacterium]|nr:VWA domain-containing protein [bacterium]
MRYAVPLIVVLAAAGGHARAAGLLIPNEKGTPPLAMVNHKVTVAVEDQVALTTVEQTFRNHTDRNQEATYIFPVPRGASVDRFSMWIDGKETNGELLPAKEADKIYTDIVRRIQDPGLLEYMGNGLMRMKVFPIPPRGDQRVKISFRSVAPRDGAVVEYTYPLRTDGRATATLEEFSVKVSLKSQLAIQNVYSPTHGVTVIRRSDKEVDVEFAKEQGILDRDFQLFYGTGGGDVGVTPLLYKPVTADDGYVMLLVSPTVDPARVRTPRDLVLVLDASSSMSEIKMQQAKRALRYCLSRLSPDDRFAVIRFSTTVTRFRDELVSANADNLERANKWVEDIRTSGGTAIWPALEEAISMQPKAAAGRAFTTIFFTDGQPTVDETNPDRIVRNVVARTSGNTRIFTFGVGDDVNAAMLDQLAEKTRAVSTYVRPAEDIKERVAGLYEKISHPVLTDLKLATGENVKLTEMYPPRLPDLFHGQQLVVMARYSGSGHSAVRLSGMVNGERKEFVYEVNFPIKTESDTGKDFVEPLWARRKVGYLLDQIRTNGEQKELMDEVVALARRYGIATPYTSHLVVPDGPMPVVPPVRPPISGPRPLPAAGGGAGGFGFAPGLPMPTGAVPGGAPARVAEFARDQVKGADPKSAPADALAAGRGAFAEKAVKAGEGALREVKDADTRRHLEAALERFKGQKQTNDDANRAFRGDRAGYQTGKLGVDLAQNTDALRNQSRLTLTANRQANGRQVLEVGGVWIDDGYKAEAPTLVVKAQSNAYFRILEKQPAMRDVFRLGNSLVWVAPCGTALVVDANDGKDTLTDAEIDALFVARR